MASEPAALHLRFDPATPGSHAPTSRGAAKTRRRAAWTLAGCLALALPSRADAFAQGPAVPPPPTQAPAGQDATGAATPEQPAAAPEASTVPEPAPETPPPPVEPSSASTSVADAAWEGVDGFEVIAEIRGGKVLRGRVGAVQRDTFTLIDGATGQILVIPKSGVASLRAYVPPPVPDKTGTGLLVGGGILTGLGGPVFISGLVFVFICPDCIELHLPMLIVGGGALGGGIPMIARGSQRRAAFQRALQEHRLAPMVTRTPFGGWSGGLQFRF